MTANGIPTESAAAPGQTVVDARGLRCPMPVVALARAAANVELGTQLVLLSAGMVPTARSGIPQRPAVGRWGNRLRRPHHRSPHECAVSTHR
jgi:hypothetical protein